MERLGYLNQKNTESAIKKDLLTKYGEGSEETWAQDMELLTDVVE